MLLKCCASKCVSYHLNTIWKYVQCCTLIDIPLYQRLLCLRCRCHKRCASDEPVTAERIRPASSGDLMRSLCMWVRRAADNLPGNRLHHTLHQWKFKSDPLRLRKRSEMYGWLSCADSLLHEFEFFLYLYSWFRLRHQFLGKESVGYVCAWRVTINSVQPKKKAVRNHKH